MIYEQVMKTKCIEINDRLIIGVSGGPDSMGLLHFLMSIQEKFNLKLYVAHINHHTRGEDNLKEEHLIRSFCEQNNIPFYVAHFNKSGTKNFHEEARTFRYQFFTRLTKELNGNKIVLAHHQNDQVETIVFKIIRGNNIQGYLGMNADYLLHDEIKVVRPFIDITKSEIIKYCETKRVPYAIDSSNLSSKYTRNRIRNQIIPLFQTIQPDFNEKIIQFHDQLAEVDDYLQQNVKIILKEMIISDETDRIILDLNKLKKLHIAMKRMILFNVVQRINDDFLELSYEKIKNLLHIIDSEKPNITFDLGKGYYCVKEYERFIFEKGKKEFDAYKILINECKDYVLPNGMELRVKKVEENAKINNKTLFLCYNSTICPLIIRTRQNGDFIQTKIGKKKINRIFIDAKIPANLRQTWPLLVDKNDNVLWVISLQKPDFSQLPNGKEKLLIEVLN